MCWKQPTMRPTALERLRECGAKSTKTRHHVSWRCCCRFAEADVGCHGSAIQTRSGIIFDSDGQAHVSVAIKNIVENSADGHKISRALKVPIDATDFFTEISSLADEIALCFDETYA